MKSMVNAMKKKNSGVPEDIFPIFEGIFQRCQDEYGPHLVGYTSFHPEWDDEFCQSMSKHLTKEQRFRLYETQGACNGAGASR